MPKEWVWWTSSMVVGANSRTIAVAPGRSGQIIAFTYDPADMTYVAESFDELLAMSLRWMEATPEDLLTLD